MSDNKIKYAFRIVHIDNIPYILEHGIVNAAKSTKKDDSYISIGDESLIEVRRNQNIIHTESCIGDYIPFYFGPRTPMLYTIQHGYNGVKNVMPRIWYTLY
ncbi:DarT ssDNA thymidine ADP-ribosyltransferase family protein [Hoylesella timonensis]|uniref:DarT ssDNA thymidine ADP-ribosyltransferase family protein n=1 Tax=Hoylesella timonensis TaxID=386414 RepID=UPI003C6CCA6D